MQPAAGSYGASPRWTLRRRERLAGILFVLPDLLGLAVFAGLPMAVSLLTGLFAVNGFGGYRFVGLANYRRMLHDRLFIESLRTTGVYVVLLVPGLYVSGLGLALLVQRRSRLSGMLRVMFFMPQMVSLVVVAIIWQVLLVDKVGVVSRLLGLFGIAGASWLGNPSIALDTVVVISIWFLMGFYMLIFLGGLQDIPREYYEAAQMDGAGWWGTLGFITLPLLKPTSLFVLLVSMVAAIAGSQAFDLIYVMTKGGPDNATALTTYYIYQQAFQFNEFGYASAMATTLVVLLMAFTLILFALTRGARFEHG